MLKIRNRKTGISLLVFALMIAFVVSGCSSKNTPASNSGSQSTKQLRVALILPGPINDNGWDSIAYQGLTNAQKQLGIHSAIARVCHNPTTRAPSGHLHSKAMT